MQKCIATNRRGERCGFAAPKQVEVLTLDRIDQEMARLEHELALRDD